MVACGAARMLAVLAAPLSMLPPLQSALWCQAMRLPSLLHRKTAAIMTGMQQ